MFCYFFLVITTFWILKPLKKGLFIGYYDESGFDLLGWQMKGSQAELLAKMLNLGVAFLAAAAFVWLARRFRRQQMTYIFSAFFLLAFAFYSTIINHPTTWVVWTFYLLGDLYVAVMVATFFAFLNDSVTAETAQRSYGMIVLGGVAGGAFGSLSVRVWVRVLDMSSWLWIAFGIGVIVMALAWQAGRSVTKQPKRETSQWPFEDEEDPTDTWWVEREFLSIRKRNISAAFEGAKLVLRSRYLLSIVGIVGLYEVVSTILDFQFTATVEHFLNGDEISVQISTIYTITTLTSLVIQLVLTNYVLNRLGVKAALFVLPAMIVAGSIGFIALPILWMGSLLNTVDNAFNHSINQSAKEILYVPTNRDEKYKAKAFIDVFIQRCAKTVAIIISLVITAVFTDFSDLWILSVVTLGVIVVWFSRVRHVGREFEKRIDPKNR